MLKKVGRFLSGRLQGSKEVRKYDDWMERNPWASTALQVGDVAGLAFGVPALAGVASKALPGLRAMLAPGAAPAATQVGRATQGAARVLNPVAKQAGKAWGWAKANPLPTAMALQGAVEGYGAGQDRRLERETLRRQREQQENLAQLLVPLYRQYYGEG